VVVSPSVTAVYSFTATDVNGCSNSASITQYVDPCMGIEKHSGENAELNIYPNPFAEKITIVSDKTPKSLQIFNSIGTLIYSRMIEGGKTEIDLNTFSNGVYLVRTGQFSQIIVKMN
jgi:hypothetical protein